MLCQCEGLESLPSGSLHSIVNDVNYRNRPLPGVPKGHFIDLIGNILVFLVKYEELVVYEGKIQL